MLHTTPVTHRPNHTRDTSTTPSLHHSYCLHHLLSRIAIQRNLKGPRVWILRRCAATTVYDLTRGLGGILAAPSGPPVPHPRGPAAPILTWMPHVAGQKSFDRVSRGFQPVRPRRCRSRGAGAGEHSIGCMALVWEPGIGCVNGNRTFGRNERHGCPQACPWVHHGALGGMGGVRAASCGWHHHHGWHHQHAVARLLGPQAMGGSAQRISLKGVEFS